MERRSAATGGLGGAALTGIMWALEHYFAAQEAALAAIAKAAQDGANQTVAVGLMELLRSCQQGLN